MDHGELPDGVALVRTTDAFTAETVPAGLLRAHRIAVGRWGRLRVDAGTLRFVWEDPDGPAPVDLTAGDSLIIPPEVPHRVEPGREAAFRVEFHR